MLLFFFKFCSTYQLFCYFSWQCDDFVDKYGNDIIKLLLEAVSPRLVCTALHLCLTTTQEKVIVMPVVDSGECVCV
jgi:hypothetical protein